MPSKHGPWVSSTRSTSNMFVKRSHMIGRRSTGISSSRIDIVFLVIFLVVASAGFSLAVGHIWIRYQRRLVQHRRHGSYQSIALVMMDSRVSSDHVAQQDQCADGNGGDIESRYSTDTIISPKFPRRVVFDANRASTRPATSTGEWKDGILDRRGRAQLKCDTTAQYAIDMVVKAPVPQSCPANTLRVLPTFGFDEGTITPPIGSPLWRRKPDSAQASDSPRQQRSGRGLVKFSDVMFRANHMANGVRCV